MQAKATRLYDLFAEDLVQATPGGAGMRYHCQNLVKDVVFKRLLRVR